MTVSTRLYARAAVEPSQEESLRRIQRLILRHCDVENPAPWQERRDALWRDLRASLIGEEELMLMADYPDVDQHIGEHAVFLDQCRSAFDVCASANDLKRMRQWLIAWFEDHFASDQTFQKWSHNRLADSEFA